MLRFFHRLAKYWLSHNTPAAAASIAFYTLFSLAPTLVFAIAIGSLILGSEKAHEFTLTWLGEFFSVEQARTLLGLLSGTEFRRHGLFATIISVVFLFFGSSAAFVNLRLILNQILGYQVETFAERVKTTLIGRAVAAIFAVATGALLIVAMVAGELVRWLANQAESSDDGARLYGLATHAVSWAVVGLVFAGVLRLLPMRKPPWRAVFPGAVTALLLFEAGRYVLTLYLSRSLIASAYGPSSAIVAIMLWIYYTTQIFLFGAAVCRVRMEHAANGRPECDPAI